MTEILPGRYRHYKGKEYEVTGIARHSETFEEMVVYKTLYAAGKMPAGSLWVRPKTMFAETVNVGGRDIPRFEYIGK